MALWVETSIGWINEDHILRVWPNAGPALRGDTREAAPGDSGIELDDGRTLTGVILGPANFPPIQPVGEPLPASKKEAP